jgi:uncharacterized membrane protein
MGLLILILRLTHIISGVFWAGATFFMVSYVEPSVKATGPEGQKFMQYLGSRSSMTAGLAVTAILSTLSGLILYVINFGSNVSSTYALVLGFGGLAGIAALLVGYFVQNRSTQRIKTIAADIESSGGPPSPDQIAEMQALSARISQGARLTATLLLIAIILMASAQPIARYFGS